MSANGHDEKNSSRANVFHSVLSTGPSRTSLSFGIGPESELPRNVSPMPAALAFTNRTIGRIILR
jgi:hypothetical protein